MVTVTEIKGIRNFKLKTNSKNELILQELIDAGYDLRISSNLIPLLNYKYFYCENGAINGGYEEKVFEDSRLPELMVFDKVKIPGMLNISN